MPTCPNCGSPVDASDRFCTSCGHTLDGADLGAEPDDAAEASADEAQGNDWISVPADPFELDVFEFSFKYPLAKGFKPIGIGVLLSFAGFLIVPYFMLMGYTYRVGRSAALGRPSPPPFEDFWGLAADGFRLFVAIGILLIPGVIAYVGLFLLEQYVLAYLVYIPMMILITAITPIFYGTGSVRGVYSDLRFLRFLTTANFWIGLAYLMGIGFLSYIALFVGTFVLFITIIGIPGAMAIWLVFPVYFGFLSAALWGRIYRDAVDSGALDGPHEIESIESRW
jgi:hypothetical protein